ncbi:MAG: ATP-dependent DNA ligase [Actinomycetota bacterium]
MGFPIAPPIEPMLAKLETEIPSGPGWRYEPKWDGFRAIVYRDSDRFRIDSRNKLRLDRYFPELIEALKPCIPDRCVLDGEIVIPSENGLDFDSLQLRLHPAESRVRKLSIEIPSSFVAFDLLASGDDDLREASLNERRSRLRADLRFGDSCVITPQTSESSVAKDWFERFEGAGMDGILAKHETLRYQPGKRVMVKVKHARTIDCVVGGYRLSKNGHTLGSLLLGLYARGFGGLKNRPPIGEDGNLVYVGFTSSMNAAKKKETLELLESMRSEESAFGHWGPGGPSRWNQEDREWFPIKLGLVCEVAFDYLQGPRFRHGTRLLRWRPDKDPSECTYEQFTPPTPFSLQDIRTLAEQGSA